MRNFLMLFALTLFTSSLFSQDRDRPKMKSAFNGKTFKGWVVPDNNIWWRIEGGILSCQNGPDKKGSILWTKKKYRDFVVELDFRFGDGTIDSGIFMRGDGPDAPQIQIGISGSLKRDMTGSPYVPKQGYPVEAKGVADLLNLSDWNTIRAQALGNVYKVWLNGQEVMSYTMQDALLTGPVGLQLHPNREMAVDFRNIRIGKL